LFSGRRGLVLALSVVLAGSILLSGCASKSQTSTPSSSGGGIDFTVSGSITAVGSSALEPLVEQAADQFMQKDPNARISVQAGGSGTGLAQIEQGSIDIGNSDLFAGEKLNSSQAAGLVDHKVCVVGCAPVVNPGVTVDNLTKQQLQDIFAGKITNWKDVGGSDQAITVINRPTSSGTRATFKKYALDGMEEAQGIALTQDSSGAVAKAVAGTPGSISYLALSYASSNNTVKMLKLDGVDPANDNIVNGKYPIWSYEHMYTKGDPQGLTKAFIDYMMSDEVKPLIQQMGYIVGSDMKVSRSS
jgi:phosphate transport system substrate-binding protein